MTVSRPNVLRLRFCAYNIKLFLGLKCSTSKVLYYETNEQIENFCEIIYFVFVRISPQFLTFPFYIVSYYNYFTTDLGEKAFQLLIPMR